MVDYPAELIERLRDNPERGTILEFAVKLQTGEVFFDTKNEIFHSAMIHNLNISRCYSCDKCAIWLHDKLIHPPANLHVECNADMPDEIRGDFEEARAIFFTSPRGSAALLRLAVQKLCAFLGEGGKNIDDDIASLVRKGLPATIQMALDTVRVIGNEAVHPGQIDLKDNPRIAESLFDLLNVIVDETISKPKRIDELYAKLPDSKKAAIAKRDGK